MFDCSMYDFVTPAIQKKSVKTQLNFLFQMSSNS